MESPTPNCAFRCPRTIHAANLLNAPLSYGRYVSATTLSLSCIFSTASHTSHATSHYVTLEFLSIGSALPQVALLRSKPQFKDCQVVSVFFSISKVVFFTTISTTSQRPQLHFISSQAATGWAIIVVYPANVRMMWVRFLRGMPNISTFSVVQTGSPPIEVPIRQRASTPGPADIILGNRHAGRNSEIPGGRWLWSGSGGVVAMSRFAGGRRGKVAR
ncbi:hypothetical protein BXZ70DRAFT_954718 [Cristinia sonorae]|uniref:Uncharacterized protein n=1 Tax=Cristinia sonorae TaxID=1940300 RepID=A0A8K0UGE3_9AGAR|nr:hypothetical protein BXZ70DRAFT_954718 [Cristinia sonorae]